MNCPLNCNHLATDTINGTFDCTFIRTGIQRKNLNGIFITIPGKPTRLRKRKGLPQKCSACVESEKRISEE